MKKYIIILLFFIVISDIFSLEEWNTALGPSYGGIFDLNGYTARPTKSVTNALGINMIMYAAWDGKPHGLFFYFGGLYPSSKIVKNNIRNYQSMILEMMLGPGFKFGLSGKLTFEYGIGFDFNSEGADYHIRTENEKYSMLFIDLGIGGNANLKLDITDALFITLGVNLSWTFIDWSLGESPIETSSKWTLNSIIGIKPYIGIGLNMYNTHSRLGKPEK